MTKKIRNCIAGAVLFLFLLPLASAQLTPNIWQKFIGEPVPVGTPDLIDFSYAGYKNGEEGIPEDFAYPILNVTDYGAMPDDGESDTQGIKTAIDAANASGGSVILFFPPGQYDVFLDDDPKEWFVIREHHVIVRGSGAQGAGRGGTTIKAHNTLDNPNDLTMFTTHGVHVRDTGYPVATRVNGSFPSGINYFDVRDTTHLRDRKFIEIRADNLLGEDFDRLCSRPLTAIPTTYENIHDGIDIKEVHEIDRIEGNRVHLKAPLITHLKSGMVVFWRDLLVGVGFEDLHIDGGFNETYQHLVQFGHGGVFLRQTAHSWIRRCRFSNVIDAYALQLSYGSSAISNIVDGKFGHNLGGISFATYCLIAFIEDYSDKGMWHGAAVSHYSAGNVVWHAGGPTIKGPDTHASQPRHTLFDNCNSHTHHTSGGTERALPHHLDGYTRWNNNVADNRSLDLWPIEGYGFSITQGNLIGYRTLGGAIPRDAYIEGFGTRVSPDSLYEAQLERRLGTLPVWITVAKDMHSEFVERIFNGSSQTDTTETPVVDPKSGGPKIEGPWLWVLVPDEHFDGTTDLLAKASDGTVTEKQIATEGASAGDKVGDYEWTPLKIFATGGNNITNMSRPLGWNGNDRVIYGFITLDSPREQHTKMFVGSDDSVRVWLNGERVHEKIKRRSASDYKESFAVTLRKGRNTLLVAVDNYSGGWSGFFGFQADAEYTVLPFASIGYALSSVDIHPEDTFTLDIYAEDAANLVKWQFDIAFDSKLLQAIDIRKGYFLAGSNGDTVFQKGTIDNQTGVIRGISEAIHNGMPISGTGLLLSITFTAKTVGETQLTLNNFQFTDDISQSIAASPLHVNISVNPKPPPDLPKLPGPKIEGPWLWVLVPDERLDNTTDLLAKVSDGTVTERHIATNGGSQGDKVGDYEWTPLKISATGGNNITNMTRPLGWNGNDRVIYGFIALDSPQEQAIEMYVGADDALKVWLNGELVRVEITLRSASDYKGEFPVTLKQGGNNLLVAVGNVGGSWSGFFGFQSGTQYTLLPHDKEDTLIWDINEDGHVNILDLILIAQDFGKTASPGSRTDVNNDGNINILDLILVAQHFGESAIGTAPTTIALEDVKGLDPATVQAWTEQARAEDDGSSAFQEGIANLERLLAALIPKQTALLPNYPNPFNPETWLPYQISEPAEVTLHIYAVNGTKVRTLALGLMPAGIYKSRSRAAYWDGRNDVGEPLASGIYFYTLTASKFTSARKMLIRK